MSKKITTNLLTIFFVITTSLALLYRISLHADLYDEIINLNVAYRVAIGNIPFYECWEAFQSGDILLSPFLWIYITFFKTTSGLILYSRILYLLAYSCLGIIVYNVFKHCVSKKQAFYIGYMCIFFEIYSLYYLWYDTISVLLFSIATILLFYTLSIRYVNKYVYFAGIATGCMAFSYPSMIIIALLIVILLLLYAVRYNNKKCIIMFILGGFSVLVLFGLYVWKIIGISNFISGLKVILSYRTVSTGGSTNYLMDIIGSFVSVNKMLILSSIILLGLYILGNRKKYAHLLFIWGIFFFSFINLFAVYKEYQGLSNYIGYIALWAPFIYKIIERNKTICKKMLYFIWFPTILTTFPVTLTSVYSSIGPIKCWQFFLPAGIVSIIFSVIWIEENFPCKTWSSSLILVLNCVALLTNFYLYVYLNQPYITSDDLRIPQGIYKGIKVNDSIKSYLDVQYILEEYQDDNNTILAGATLRPIYLMSDLLPVTPSVESPYYYKGEKIQWEMTLKYFKKMKKIPDIMFLEDFAIEDQKIESLLHKYYKEPAEYYIDNLHFFVYVRNDKKYQE